MKHLHARRAVLLTLALVAATFFAAAQTASAVIAPEIKTTLSDPQLGAHSDLTVDMNFGYGGEATIAHSHANPFVSMVEDPFTYPAGTDFRETLDSLVVDIPPGLVGNPNAVPYAERCPIETFRNSICPDSATVGIFRISNSLVGRDDEDAPEAAGEFLISVFTNEVEFLGGVTRVSLLQSDPEVPAKIGIYVSPAMGVGGPIRTLMEIAPDTNGDLRLRTTTPEGINTLLTDPEDPSFPVVWARTNWMQLTFFGRLPNGRAFMTNPTDCSKWRSTIWASSTYGNHGADETPLGAGHGAF